MFAIYRYDFDLARTGIRIFSQAKLVVIALVLIFSHAEAQGQPEVLPRPRVLGSDPNRSENEVPVAQGEAPVPELETDVAKRIKLNRDEPWFQDIIDKEEVLGGKLHENEARAYDIIFKHAHEFSPEQLAEHSLKGSNNKGLPHADLVGDGRKDFLRQLVHLEGRLIRVRQMAPTEELAKQFSVLYEGWFLNHDNPEYPVCVVFSELPEGLVPGDNLSYPVTVDGYYFKLRKYKSQEKMPAKEPGKKDQFVERVAPLILTRTIRVQESALDVWSLGSFFVPVVAGVVIVLGLVTMSLIWWFRRGDRRVQKMNAQALTKKNPFEEEKLADESALPVWNRMNPPLPPH